MTALTDPVPRKPAPFEGPLNAAMEEIGRRGGSLLSPVGLWRSRLTGTDAEREAWCSLTCPTSMGVIHLPSQEIVVVPDAEFLRMLTPEDALIEGGLPLADVPSEGIVVPQELVAPGSMSYGCQALPEIQLLRLVFGDLCEEIAGELSAMPDAHFQIVHHNTAFTEPLGFSLVFFPLNAYGSGMSTCTPLDAPIRTIWAVPRGPGAARRTGTADGVPVFQPNALY